MLELANAFISLLFDPVHAGVRGLRDARTDVQHIGAVPGEYELWQLAFTNHTRSLTLSSQDHPFTASGIEAGPEGRRVARFEWQDLRLGDEPAAVTVRVTVELPPDSGLAEWRIWVDNRSPTLGLADVEFPRLSGFLEAGAYDVAFPHRNWGRQFPRCAERLTGDYPTGWSMPVQFCAASRGDSSVYMATHDPAAWMKTFTLDPGKLFTVRTYAENMGVPGSGHRAPFPAIVGVYRGGWLEAAKHYRRFAVTAPWTAGGRLARRADTPQAIKDVGLWMQVHNHIGPEGGSPEERNQPLAAAQAFFGVPLAAHWYCWHAIPFDTHYPHYFPTLAGIPAQVHNLVRDGIVVMPYINGRIVDKSNADFADYRPFTTKKPDGELHEEDYGNGVKQAVMCAATPFWQNKVAELVDRVGGEVGANAVYIDQIAAAGPPLCFDASHGHPLGGGSWWGDGYRTMLRRVREAAHRSGRDMAITSECVAEPFMDGLDAFLVWQPRAANDIPLMAAVYSGYTLYFASPEPLNQSDRGWIMIQGRDFLWGCQNGWMGTELLAPEHARKAAFLRQIGKFRVAGRKYLTNGELVGLLDHVETVTEPWVTGPATLPIVQGAVWRAEDGSLGIFLVNYLDREASFTFTLDPAQFGLAPGPAGYVMERLTLGEAPVLDNAPGRAASRTENLGPTEIRFLTVRSTGSPPG